ncbi:amidophosphoribosyltransferase [Kiloniella spongiae]|uniref:Amidophosphoribosyltransferase n=1 Tax=Kiloniella spongiae TaxID=1489064 RepID=A0A0H2MU40_9PROT|nr:amidophosphoribosyltransferase [Kiloniella spongiae]KLN60225.1 amidophosphoribosyltransferase [Kiloniella spongiae]
MTLEDFHDDDKLHEECGVYAVHGHEGAAALVTLGLHALQHRGQEAAGIISYDGNEFYNHRALGLVGDNFSSQEVIERLKGHVSIGHTRYSTTGETALRNVQPLFAELHDGGFALCHNGNLTNSQKIRDQLVMRGSIFQSTMDTEVILHLVATSIQDTIVGKVTDAIQRIEGAYALLCMTKEGVIAVRDPHGIRPLVLGELDGGYVVASETCALDIIGADFIRDVDPGEMIVITDDGIQSLRPFPPTRQQTCIFEYIYFARPDSFIDGVSVYEARKNIGKELALESHVESDVVVPVPDSGVPAAIGYSQESGVPFELGIIRNHYVGRTFIEPGQQIRNLGVKLKHNANKAVLEGKRVILVDDSLVRGTTSIKIVEMVKAAGAKEVHMRIASPPIGYPYFYGIDISQSKELLAAQMDLDEMAAHIGVDSLAFLSIDGMYKAMGQEGRNPDAPQYCDAPFTGHYPTQIDDYEDHVVDVPRFMKPKKAG